MDPDRTIDRSVDVDPQLRRARGTVEVLVRFKQTAITGELDRSRTIAALKRRSKASQSVLTTFSKSTDGVEIVRRFWIANAALVRIDTREVSLQRIGALRGVVGVHPNAVVRIPPDRPGNRSVRPQPTANRINATYGLHQINAPDVWQRYGTRGGDVKVAVLDTGVDVSHPDIELYTTDETDPTYPGGWAEFNASGGRVPNSRPHDTAEHGTHTSGTVSGGNASGRYIGVAPSVKLMHGLVLPEERGTTAQILAGMEWAVANGADVISMSLGGSPGDPVYIKAIKNAEKAGTLVVVSAGNSGPGTASSPGDVYEALTVGASNSSGAITDFSSGKRVHTSELYGRYAPFDWPNQYVLPDVAAPGKHVYSSVPGGTYKNFSGTSMAAPHAAGAAALLMSINESASVYTVKSALYRTATKPSRAPSTKDIRYGFGIIDVLAAAELIADQTGVRGTVTTTNGTPISSAVVRSSSRAFDSTGRNGTYAVLTSNGTVTITADAFGYRRTTKRVTVSDGEYVSQRIVLNETVDVTQFSTATPAIESSESIDLQMGATNVDSVVVRLGPNSTVNASAATVYMRGRRAAIGERIHFDRPIERASTALSVSVEEDANGSLSLAITFSGARTQTTRRTDRIRVYSEMVDVGVIEVHGGFFGERIASTLDDRLAPVYDVSTILPRTATANVDEYDVFVVQSLPDDLQSMVSFIAQIRQTPVVYLESYAGGLQRFPVVISNGITAKSLVTGDPAAVYETKSRDSIRVNYTITRDHPVFDGVGKPGETVTMYLSLEARRAWFANYRGTPLARLENRTVSNGTTVAVNDSRNEVLLTLGRHVFSLFGDPADQLLTNAVRYLTPAVQVHNQTFQKRTTSVTVANATYTESDFAVAIHNGSGGSAGPIIGWANVSAGANEDVRVPLDRPLTRNVTVTATLHKGFQRPPITRGGAPVTDTATIMITAAPTGPANFQVSNLQVPMSVNRTEQLSVSATITNTGGQQATQVVELRVDGDGNGTLEADEELANRTVTLIPGASTTVTFTRPVPQNAPLGSTKVGIFTANDSAVQNVTITRASGGENVNVTRRLGSTTVPAGGTATVTLALDIKTSMDRLSVTESFSPAFASANLKSVSVNGQTVSPFFAPIQNDSLTVVLRNLAAGDTVRVTYEVTPPGGAASGDTFTISGSVTTPSGKISTGQKTLEIAAGAEAYAGRDNVVQTNELRTAIQDWVRGKIGTSLLRTVIQAWVTGQPV